MARATAGAARLTAHGSGGGVVLVGGGGSGVADVVGAVVLVGSGVFATVESPDPHPVRTASSTTAAAADARNVHIRARLPANCAPTRQAGPGPPIRLLPDDNCRPGRTGCSRGHRGDLRRPANSPRR